jgi:hypothetical protein
VSRNIYTYLIFFFATTTLILAFLGWQVEQRNNTLEELQEATTRVEEAATHTEEVLLDLVEARSTPERLARDTRVTEALNQIEVILGLLCEIDDPVRAEACAGLDP